MCHQAPNVWVLQCHSDTPSQDLRSLVGKCFALSPILLSTGSAYSDMDDASFDASFTFLYASYILFVSQKLVVIVKVWSHQEWWWVMVLVGDGGGGGSSGGSVMVIVGCYGHVVVAA